MAAKLPLELSATIGENQLTFIVDTGSSLSILPYDSALSSFLHPTGISLRNASGAAITIHGELNAQVKIPAARRIFNFTFVVAEVMQPILGLDFLVSHGLIVDPKNKILIDSNTNVRIPLKCTHQTFSAYSIDYHNVDPRAQELLLQFPTLTAPLNLHKNSCDCP